MAALRTSARTRILSSRALFTSSMGGTAAEEDNFDIDDFAGQEQVTDDIPMFSFWPFSDTQKRIKDSVARISSCFGISESVAELLLLSFRWDRYRLESALCEEDSDKVLVNAGVCTNPHPAINGTECSVCCNDLVAEESFGLGCGHGPFCLDCWSNHIDQQLAAGKFVIKCMTSGCDVLMLDEQVRRLAKPASYSKFRAAINRTFIELNPKLGWCPNPRSCDWISEFRGIGRPPMVTECSGCHFKFCYACKHPRHTPIPCEMVTLWDQKAQDPDAQLSMDWLLSNTKKCPKCSTPIQKNEGCNHMTCRLAGCGFEFCWLCRADWKTHGSHTGGFYSCNKYEESAAKKEDDKMANTKKELDRYLHHYNRHMNYKKDLDQAEKKLDAARKKMIEFTKEVTPNRFGMNPQFMLDAVNLELECRAVLQWTYVLSYFMEEGTRQKEWFLFLQANLEGITERLADMNKSALKNQDDDELKTRSKATAKYLEAMTQAMQDEANNFMKEKDLAKRGKLTTSGFKVPILNQAAAASSSSTSATTLH